MQVESALAVQNLKPTIDTIKAQYGEDKKRIQRETTALYQKSGVNPLAGAQHSDARLPPFQLLARAIVCSPRFCAPVSSACAPAGLC